MRVVKRTEWNLVGYNSHGFVFTNTQYPNELLVIPEAKYVISKDVVLFITYDKAPVVRPSNSTKSDSLTSVYQIFQSIMRTANKRFQIA